MEFSVLGPLTVQDSDGAIEVRGPRRRALLLRLLIDANRVVSADVLADDLWEGGPPPSATASLRSHLSHLRRLLGRDRIISQAPGYLLHVADGELDRAAFEHDVAAGRSALIAGEADASVVQLERALARWRGTAFADVSGAAWATGEVARLDELRCLALEQLLDARLSLGQHIEVIGRAEAAVADHPLRERLWVAFITALVRAGRQADALRSYQRVRAVLAGDLGHEPSAELRQLEARVLAQDPLLISHSRVQLSTSAVPVERELPTGVVTFLLTDVVGSTRLWDADPVQMDAALARHDELLRESVAQHRGVLVKARGEGDSSFSVFQRATDATAAALVVQTAVQREAWPANTPIRLRVAVHTGEASERDGDYYGPAVNRVARLRAIADADQVLITQATAALVIDHLPHGRHISEVGLRELRDLERPEPVYLLTDDGVPSDPENAGGSTEQMPTRQAPSRIGDLRKAVSTFVGREALLGEVLVLLRDVHLVTLTGPGGVGKTRVAVEVAGQLSAEFPDGIWFADLSALVDSSQVDEAVAAALAIPRLPGTRAVDAVVERLRRRRALVVLDNCEHVLDGVSVLVERVVQGDGASMLLTTREHLGLSGEHTVVVEPLGLPSDKAIETGDLAGVEAVELFVERARSARNGFTLTAQNAKAVGRVCRRLDGLPLAVELAAARIRSMTPEEIERHLDDRLELLHAPKNPTSRHRRLLDTIEWSYDLLDVDERLLFRTLSAFTGGCDLDAVLAVATIDASDRVRVVDLLDRLVEKSLVVADPDSGGTRYRMLETIRSFARARLDASDDAPRARQRHAEYFADLVRFEGDRMFSPDESLAVDRLERELDNIRAAQRWAIDNGDVDLAFFLVVPLARPSHPIALAGAAAAREIISLPGAEHHPRFPLLLGSATWVTGELGGAAGEEQLRALEQAANLAALTDPQDEAFLLNWASANAIYLGRLEQARELSLLGRALATQQADDVDESSLWCQRAALEYMQHEDCRVSAQAALAAAERVGSPSLIATARFMVGWSESDAQRCLAEFERGLLLAASARNDYIRAIGLNMLAVVHARLGDHTTALPVLLRGAELAHECGERITFTINMNMIAATLAVIAHNETAWLIRTWAPTLRDIPLMNQLAADALEELPGRLDPVTAWEISARAAGLTDAEVLAIARAEVDDILGRSGGFGERG